MRPHFLAYRRFSAARSGALADVLDGAARFPSPRGASLERLAQRHNGRPYAGVFEPGTETMVPACCDSFSRLNGRKKQDICKLRRPSGTRNA